MAERYSKADAERQFLRLCDLLRQRVATSYDDHGAWALDYVAEYGGFVVERIDDETSGVSHPLGDRRHSAREFCQMVHFLARALEVRNG